MEIKTVIEYYFMVKDKENKVSCVKIQKRTKGKGMSQQIESRWLRGTTHVTHKRRFGIRDPPHVPINIIFIFLLYLFIYLFLFWVYRFAL